MDRKIELLCGDCLELLKAVPENSVDLVLADLPYGITSAKWDCELPLDVLWDHYERVAKPNAAIVLFSAQPFTSKLIMSKVNWFKYCWYWEKEKGTGFLNAKNQPLRCIEEICVFYKKKGIYNPQMVPLDKPYRHKLPTSKSETINDVSSFNEEKKYKVYTHSYPKNILKYARDNANKGSHSTQKPVALVEYLVETYSTEGDLVLDNTMGSGTAGVACKRLGRSFIGMELDDKMFKIAQDRINTMDRHILVP